MAMVAGLGGTHAELATVAPAEIGTREAADTGALPRSSASNRTYGPDHAELLFLSESDVETVTTS